MGRFFDWFSGIGPAVAPSIEESEAEGFKRAKPNGGPIFLGKGDVMNISISDVELRLHGTGQGSFLLMERRPK